MPSKLKLTPEDYDRLDKLVNRQGTEYYSIVTTKLRGKFVRSVHVFARQPMTKELTQFENTASKVKIRGQRTDVEGSQILAYKHLYDALIARAYDVPVGWQIHGDAKPDEQGVAQGGLSREQAIEIVPTLLKREALRDVIGESYSEARIDEMVGDDEEVHGQKGED